jgi:hypothetical protein
MTFSYYTCTNITQTGPLQSNRDTYNRHYTNKSNICETDTGKEERYIWIFD